MSPLPALILILQASRSTSATIDVAKFADPDHRVEQEPKHEGMLHVVGLVHDLVEQAEVIGVQDAGQLAALLGRSKLAFLPHLLGDVSPAFVVQSGPPHDAGDLGDNFRFRFFVLGCESGGVFVIFECS